MVSPGLLLAFAWCGAGAAADGPAISPLQAEYAARLAQAGGDATAQVRLALWCEEQRLAPERLKHLTRAVLIAPGNPLARGLLGMVEYKGRWRFPEAVTAELQGGGEQAAALAEYNARRDRLAERAAVVGTRTQALKEKRQFVRAQAYLARETRVLAMERDKLGSWCREAGLDPEATAEFATAVHLDPEFDDAWKHMGYVRHNGRWMSPEQVAAAVAEAKAQAAADHHWEPLLRRWRSWLREPRRKTDAAERLGEVTDPRAVAAVGRVFLTPSPDEQAWAVRLLGAIDAVTSTRMLARVAAYSDFEPVRNAAIAALARRPPNDYVPLLVALIRSPATYAVEPVRGPGTTGCLVVDTPRYRLERTYDAPPPVNMPLLKLGSGFMGYDHNGLPVYFSEFELESWRRDAGHDPMGAMIFQQERKLREREQEMQVLIAAANLKAVAAQQQLAADIRDVEAMNAEITAVNTRARAVLREAAKAPDLGQDAVAWWRWSYDQRGYNYVPPPKVYTRDAMPAIPAPLVISCFAAGTPVKTRQGPRAIETIQTGDLVLAQDATTGALAFQPVTAVHHNQPAATVRLRLDNGEEIVPSTYHRFWLAGRGWVMARDLKPGDPLRALSGRIKVAQVGPGETVPVFNLDIASHHTYFVGDHDYLVHDNTYPSTLTVVFDLPPGPEPHRPPL